MGCWLAGQMINPLSVCSGLCLDSVIPNDPLLELRTVSRVMVRAFEGGVGRQLVLGFLLWMPHYSIKPFVRLLISLIFICFYLIFILFHKYHTSARGDNIFKQLN